MRRKHNQYDLSGEYGIGYTSNTNKPFYFDLEDYDRIKDYCWFANAYGYIASKYNSKIIFLHKIIMDTTDKIIDHINHNTTDNRKNNLRIVTKSQNAANHNILRNNTSGVTGVDKRIDGKWRARIRINNKIIFLGNYTDFNDAVRARKQAEEKYFGQYSYDNSMKESIYNK